MTELVSNCPRCGAKRITFDLTAANEIHRRYNWQKRFEVFCVCRNCRQTTIFVIGQKEIRATEHIERLGPAGMDGSANNYFEVEGFISLKDFGRRSPPEHLPPDIKSAFEEGATCLAVNCYNAAGTMFRLCVDLATRALLPAQDSNGLNAQIRRNLGLRLPWLFDNSKLPPNLRDLSTCIKNDGNDGAHAGTLTEKDAENLLDFTFLLLDRLCSEPERLRLAKMRRENRSDPKP